MLPNSNNPAHIVYKMGAMRHILCQKGIGSYSEIDKMTMHDATIAYLYTTLLCKQPTGETEQNE